MTEPLLVPAPVLRAYDLDGAHLTLDESGLINRTWIVGEPGAESSVLQAVNAVFPASVNTDIDKVTQHLEACGIVTPRIIRTADDEVCVTSESQTWRLLSYIPGVTLHRLTDPALAGSAGRLLGRFHSALESLEIRFSNARPGVHDTPAHLEALAGALTEHSGSGRVRLAEPIANDILELAAALPALPLDRDIAVHGDPKVSNVRFVTRTGPALSLLDLDTLTRMPVCLELGDAMRSWCNLTTEDDDSANFSLAHFRAALGGYHASAPGIFRRCDLDAVAPATLTITVELAARFCRDAIEACYFSWDPARFESRSAHNLARARSQLTLARSLVGQMGEAGRIAADIGPVHD